MSLIPKSSLQVRIARFFIPLTVLAYGLACLLSFSLSDRVFFERFRQTLETHAALIATNIDGDAFKGIQKEEDPAYRSIKETLIRHRSAIPSIRDVYTMRPSRGPIWNFVVDAEPSASDLYSPPGEPYDTRQDPAIPEGIQGTSSSHTLTVDRWGTWLSGYAPIRTKRGEKVGIVGLDLSAAQYLRERSLLVRMALGVFFLGLLLASGLGFWFARRIARTEEAIQLELQQARDQAIEAAKLKASFLSTVSHEIRTPMHAILSMNTLLLGSRLEEEPRHFAEIMLDSTKSLLSIIDDVLDSSKIEAGKMHLENIPFSPLELVEAVAELFAPKALEKGLTLQTFVAPDLPAQLEGDPSRIRQVLLNLISNAIKFTQTGQILIEATKQADALRFEVIDTGIGISKEAQKRLLQPFVQADNTMSRRFGGTGLGLYLCKSLIDLMQGKFEIESEEGRGSTFRIELPLRVSDPSVEASPRCGRVLIALSFQEDPLLGRYLTAWGIPHTSVAEEELCLAMAAAPDPFEVVILDGPIPDPAPAEARWILMSTFGENPSNYSAVLQAPLKRRALREALEPQGTKQVKTENAPRPLFQQAPLLLAEDNPINREIALRYLSRLGLEVHVATNGREALEACQARSFELILMDCQMPEMDGFEATRAIRQLESPRRTPILAMTAGAMEEERMRCEEAGMDGFLGKPYTEEELTRTLQRWLGGSILSLNDLRKNFPSEEDLRGLFETFFESADALLLKMQNDAERGDHAQLARNAHELKGAAGFMTAERIVRQCKALERAAAAHDEPTIQGGIEALSRFIEETKTTLAASSEPSTHFE